MHFPNAFFVFSALLNLGNCANILGVFPVPSQSHDILGSTLLKHLASIGHNVTYISSFPHKHHKNFHHIHVKECHIFKEERMKKYTQGNATLLDVIIQASNINDLTSAFYENEYVQKLITSNSKFDLLIHFMGVDATMALGGHFDCPIIVFSPVGGFPPLDHMTGNPAPASYVPSAMLPFTDEMTFLQRTVNALTSCIIFPVMGKVANWSANKCIAKYLPNSPKFEGLFNRIEMVLINSHISTETPRPYVPNMIQIGGYHLQKPEPLSDDLKKVLDEAKEGFVYFSFGTNVIVNELPENIVVALKKVLAKLPLKVVMKYEDDTMSDKPDNFHLGKWFPQPSVLAHPNAKLFIGHGGYGGYIESLFYGVPMVCIPFFGDQSKNCGDAEKNGYSITVNLHDLNEENLRSAIQKVLHDQKFKAAVQFKSELYRDQPMNPMDKAVYWIEHVIKYKGAKHLRVKGATLPWHQYYLLDVFLFIGIVLFAFVSVIFYSCKFVCRKMCTRKNKVKVH